MGPMHTILLSNIALFSTSFLRGSDKSGQSGTKGKVLILSGRPSEPRYSLLIRGITELIVVFLHVPQFTWVKIPISLWCESDQLSLDLNAIWGPKTTFYF